MNTELGTTWYNVYILITGKIQDYTPDIAALPLKMVQSTSINTIKQPDTVERRQ